jgi:Zn ribbon nucleic-acid-binding protein
MNIKSYLDTLTIAEGQRLRMDCPQCKARNTFTVWKDNGLLVYHCFKLSCTVRGAYGVNLTADEIKIKLQGHTKQEKTELDRMDVPEYVVKPSVEHPLIQDYIRRWGLYDEELMYDVKDRRAVFLIRENNRLIDAVGRSLDGIATPKWFRYTGEASVFTRLLGSSNGIVVVVEDVISAITIAHLFPNTTGLAILGTSLGEAQMQHIQNYFKVVVALDPDAAHKTLQYKRDIEAWTGLDTMAFRLVDDIKYKVEEDIDRLEKILI